MGDDSTFERPKRGSATATVRRPVVLTLLAHPDARRIGESATLEPTARLSRLEPELCPPGATKGTPLDDRYVSRQPARLDTTATGVTITAPTGGAAIRVDGRVLSGSTTIEAARLDSGVVLELAERVALLLHRRALGSDADDLGLPGGSEAIVRVRDQVRRVGDLRVPVCVLGESGTGKELVAEAIHRISGRSGPYAAVNMATVTSTTGVSQLFGHVRGAFTSAAAPHRGLFVAADGGTLLLDEIAETSDEVQAMLLRVLETHEVVALGADRGQRVDVRVIAATDRDLEELVRLGKFRAPLWHRLAGAVIPVPPLRARRDDVARLLYRFLAEELAAAGEPDRLATTSPGGEPYLAAPLVAALCRHDWPGNVRELRNVARRIVVSSRGLDEVVLDDDLAARFGEPPEAIEPEALSLPEVLERHQWRIGETAAALGISRTTLYARIEACPGIRKAGDLTAAELDPLLAESGRDLDVMARALRVSRRGLQLRLRELGL